MNLASSPNILSPFTIVKAKSRKEVMLKDRTEMRRDDINYEGQKDS